MQHAGLGPGKLPQRGGHRGGAMCAGAGDEGSGLQNQQGRGRGGQGGPLGRRGRARKVQVPDLRAAGP